MPQMSIWTIEDWHLRIAEKFHAQVLKASTEKHVDVSIKKFSMFFMKVVPCKMSEKSTSTSKNISAVSLYAYRVNRILTCTSLLLAWKQSK